MQMPNTTREPPAGRRRSQAVGTLAALAAAGAVVVWMAPAFGEGPGFDCGKADGSVEELICRDSELAALDRTLTAAYQRALERAAEDNYEDPRPLQRGWVTGRNDCWKAKDARACVEASYKQRIAELQIGYGDFVVPSPVTYACDAFDMSAVFYRETDPPTVVLTPVGRHEGAAQALAFLAPSASGAKYEGANVVFWEHHGEAMLTWFGEELTCRVKGR